MRWYKVIKTPNPSLEHRFDKAQVKMHIREEASRHCVYCAINENRIGGYRSFCIEHYRPKAHFPDLEYSLINLYYACPVCNGFKQDTWLADPDEQYTSCAFPDPAEVDYTRLFTESENGILEGCYPTSNYLIWKLFLNRPQLILARKEESLDERRQELQTELIGLYRKLSNCSDLEKNSNEIAVRLLDSFNALSSLMDQGKELPYYEPSQIMRHIT